VSKPIHYQISGPLHSGEIGVSGQTPARRVSADPGCFSRQVQHVSRFTSEREFHDGATSKMARVTTLAKPLSAMTLTTVQPGDKPVYVSTMSEPSRWEADLRCPRHGFGWRSICRRNRCRCRFAWIRCSGNIYSTWAHLVLR